MQQNAKTPADILTRCGSVNSSAKLFLCSATKSPPSVGSKGTEFCAADEPVMHTKYLIMADNYVVTEIILLI